ncbi:MAG: hypothetical protein ACRCTQ_00075 [Brevinemataceae bacterium]
MFDALMTILLVSIVYLLWRLVQSTVYYYHQTVLILYPIVHYIRAIIAFIKQKLKQFLLFLKRMFSTKHLQLSHSQNEEITLLKDNIEVILLAD